MGWGNCGTDSRGRPIGYCHPARCDHPGCGARIDRGLAYACGGMHGNESLGGDDDIDWSADAPPCDRYFCEKHLRGADLEHEDGADLCSPALCFECAADLERRYWTDEEWRDKWPTDAGPATWHDSDQSGEAIETAETGSTVGASAGLEEASPESHRHD